MISTVTVLDSVEEARDAELEARADYEHRYERAVGRPLDTVLGDRWWPLTADR